MKCSGWFLTPLAVIVAVTACQGAKVAAPTAAVTADVASPVAVETVPVAIQPMPRRLVLTGSLVANQQADVAANASGRVARTLVERGDEVRSGAVLLQLDAKASGFSEAEARANQATYERRSQLAASQCQRNEALYKKGALSKDEWDRIESECQTAVSSADAARARADLAQKNLADAQVRAPFKGRINERFVSVGEYVQPSTKVVNLIEISPLRLQLTLAESDLGQAKRGQRVTFTVQAYPQETFTGVLQYLGTAVRSSTRDLLVEALVENADGRLRPGMFAAAELALPDAPLPVVPATAVRRDGSTRRIFVQVADHLEERIVAVGPERDGQVGILDGLIDGEHVVVAPGESARDGLKVL